jgi:shikimate kinase
VLVGMMGAGKSTIGRRLAARLRLPFLDADTEIERRPACRSRKSSPPMASRISATARRG